MKLPKELKEKRGLTGKAGKGKLCSIIECSKPAIRSLSESKWGKIVEESGLKFKENKLHKIYLCKEHYKESNKVRKSQEKIYQKKGFLEDSHATKKGSWDYY